VKQFTQATQAHSDADWMFENTELGHVRFHLNMVLLFSQYISGDACGARRVGAEAGDELRLHA
jgi:uroporphyrinogen-III decarboxylase